MITHCMLLRLAGKRRQGCPGLQEKVGYPHREDYPGKDQRYTVCLSIRACAIGRSPPCHAGQGRGTVKECPLSSRKAYVESACEAGLPYQPRFDVKPWKHSA